MLPKPPKLSLRSSTWRYLALSWPILVATCCQLGPNFAYPAPIFAPTCTKLFENRAQDTKRCRKIHQHCASTRFSRHRPLPGIPKYKKTDVSLRFCEISAIQPMCQNSPKMLPKPPKLSPRSPTWRYHGPSWSQLAANLAPTLPILRPCSRQPAQKFLESRAQDAKTRSKIPQGDSSSQFY